MSGRKHKFLEAYVVEHFEELLGREWINRVWTYQEIILATNPVIVCGNKSLSWDNFVRGIEFLFNSKMGRKDEEDARQLPKQCEAWRTLFRVWMHIDRATHWNGIQLSRAVPYKVADPVMNTKSRYSFYAYQSRFHRYVLLINTFLWLMWLTAGALILAFLILRKQSNGPLSFLLWTVLLPMVILLYTYIYYEHHVLHLTPPGEDDDKFTFELSFLEATGDRLPNEYLPVPGKENRHMFPPIHRAFRNRLAKDPKDRSYSMYGVLKSLGLSLTNPDYGRRIPQIYQEFFIDILKWSGSLNLLLDSGFHGFQNVPSWVPDWSAAAENDWLDSRYIDVETDATATEASKSAWELCGGNLLKVSGCLLQSKVILCFGRFEQHDELSDNLHNVIIFLRLLSAARLHARLLGINDTISNAFFEILHARAFTRIISTHRDDFNEWYQILISDHFEDENVDAYAAKCLDLIANNSRATSYFIGRCNKLATENRIVFITSDGHLGTGPEYTAPKDQVALISGVAMPLILRSNEDGRHQIVGPSYIYGMMEGERWTGENLEDVELV